MFRENSITSEYMPISKKANKYFINFDYIENDNVGSWEVAVFKYKPHFNEIKTLIETYYNDKCTSNIENGLIWNDMNVYLSLENQQNYKAMYDLAYQTKGKNLPLTVKLYKNDAPVYYTFNTIEEIEDFYVSINKHIQHELTKCWERKEIINWENYKF